MHDDCLRTSCKGGGNAPDQMLLDLDFNDIGPRDLTDWSTSSCPHRGGKKMRHPVPSG